MPSLTRSAVEVLARTSVPPCFSVMPMPMVTDGFLHPGPVGRIIFARQDLRRPFLLHRRRCGDRRNRGAGHRQRAEMAAFELRRQVKADGAGLVRLAAFVGVVVPDGGMQARRHRAAHQRMPGGMELDDVETFAARTVGAQLRHALIGHARQILRLRRGHIAADRFEIVAHAALASARRYRPPADRTGRH